MGGMENKCVSGLRKKKGGGLITGIKMKIICRGTPTNWNYDDLDLINLLK